MPAARDSPCTPTHHDDGDDTYVRDRGAVKATGASTSITKMDPQTESMMMVATMLPTIMVVKQKYSSTNAPDSTSSHHEEIMTVTVTP